MQSNVRMAAGNVQECAYRQSVRKMCDHGVRLVVEMIRSVDGHSQVHVVKATIPSAKMDERIAEMVLCAAHKTMLWYDHARAVYGVCDKTAVLFSILFNEEREELSDENIKEYAGTLRCSEDSIKWYLGLWHNEMSQKAVSVIVSEADRRDDEEHIRVANSKKELYGHVAIGLASICHNARFNIHSDMPTYTFTAVYRDGQDDYDRTFNMTADVKNMVASMIQ